ncbi:hypothetical protein FH972_002588 [Carpinus fangiana]|uniref:Uncharacterized protein n=1 Tax=Carpinus fangiana TaxID=176857 RepID=A0A5N6QFB5_9ROSI|nr:hypothetical protein FH972_002588 [Carpinus fangiana]
MAGRASKNPKLNSKALDGNEMVIMGVELSQKPGVDLMQNCDLPPPMKVFTGSDTTVVSSMNRILGATEKEDDNDEFHVYISGGENEKLELLKALRLSQTRAREAEKKAAALVKERDCVSNALLEEATRLFAYRQWVRLLELQVTQKQKGCGYGGLKEEDHGGEDGSGVTWFMAFAFCLGFVGVGFVFGCRYLF